MTQSVVERAQRLIAPLQELYNQARAVEQAQTEQLQQIEPIFRASACNLLHYLALRQHDLRQLQNELTMLGLSSLGRLEAHTLATLEAVLVALHRLADQAPPPLASPPVSFHSGPMHLHEHSLQLLGVASGKRDVRIMVTMPSEAATDSSLIRSLLAAGMDVMRINCAHDEPAAWLAMIQNLRQAERALGRPCKILADLAGPKLRTGALEPVGHLLKYQPRRDVRGRVVAPAQLWVPRTTAGAPHPTYPTLPLADDLGQRLQVGDAVTFKDTRRHKRTLLIVAVDERGCLAAAEQTGYVEAGLPLQLWRSQTVIAKGSFGALPPYSMPITLLVGDTLLLTDDSQPGRPAQRDANGAILQPAQIPVTLPAVFQTVQPDERIWFDDGNIGGRVLANDGQRISVEITQARPGGGKLGSEKGINLPDTHLPIPALSEKDRAALGALNHHIDMVGLSFVRTPDDVQGLHQILHELGAPQVGVVLKIETPQAFENLPRLLLTSLRKPPVGVMVARGDLAVELGFERLAEVQEEILWLCEAAHVPVIWATQVLESMAKQGMPSRAEVSDAVMSGRAECVMLNKGPYIVPAVRLLNGVLERMAAHQTKKRTMLRKLAISQGIYSV